MPDAHLIEQRLASQELFKGRFLHAFRDTVRLPDGGEATREYVVHPGAVVVVPLLQGPDGRLRIVLERQYRYPVGRVMVELPAGKLDAGEDPLVCGQRELLEETGYEAREWARAGQMHLAIAYSTEVIHIYFARGLCKYFLLVRYGTYGFGMNPKFAIHNDLGRKPRCFHVLGLRFLLCQEH